jgi:hypothetical protein
MGLTNGTAAAVRSTWAPKGQTPVLKERMRGSRQRISMASFLAYKLSKDGLCEGADARLYFEVQRASFTSASLIGVLCNLSMELDEPGAEPMARHARLGQHPHSPFREHARVHRRVPLG